MFEIVIEDSGIGIPPETIKNIFDRFFTKKANIISEIPAGTGIGLALVKELVELHHGSISVESEVNKGTKFIIMLPYDKKYYEDLKIEIISAKEGSIDETKPGNEILDKDFNREETPLILIVEDNEDIIKLLKECIDSHDLSEREKIHRY